MAFSGFTVGGTNLPALRDDFNRANASVPGPLWADPLFTGEGSCGIDTNGLTNTFDVGNSAGCYTVSDEASADLAVVIVLGAWPATDTNHVSIYVRLPSSELPLDDSGATEDYYRLNIQREAGAGNDAFTMRRIVDGASTTLTPATGANSIGDDLATGDAIGWLLRENGGVTEASAWFMPSGGVWTQTATWSDSNAGRRTALGRTALELTDISGGGPGALTIDAVYVEEYVPPVGQKVRPDADTTTTGWTSTPLFSKINEASPDGTVITATAA